MLNGKQILGLILLSIGVISSIYALQEGIGTALLVLGIVLSLAGISLVFWANR